MKRPTALAVTFLLASDLVWAWLVAGALGSRDNIGRADARHLVAVVLAVAIATNACGILLFRRAKYGLFVLVIVLPLPVMFYYVLFHVTN